MSFKEWYATHGEALKKARREKYQGNEAHREAEKARRRTYLEKQRAERKVRLDAEEQAGKLPQHTWRAYEEHTAEGVVTYYTFSAACEIVGISGATLRSWYRMGKLALPTKTLPTGAHLYGPEDLRATREEMARHSRLGTHNYSAEYVAHIRFPDGRCSREVMFKVGGLSSRVHRAVGTLMKLEERGAYPRTPFLSPDGRRLYTETMATALEKALGDLQRVSDRAVGEVRTAMDKVWARYEGAVLEKLSLDTDPDLSGSGARGGADA